jgi:hypothetical protein
MLLEFSKRCVLDQVARQKHQVGTTHLGALGPPGAPWWVVVPTWAPSLISSSHIITYLQKKFTIALALVFLLSNPRISIFLLEAPFPKLFRGIVAWYVTPPLVQLVFALAVYILNNYLLLVLL